MRFTWPQVTTVNATREDVKETAKKIARHNRLARDYADSCATIESIDPVVTLALQPSGNANLPIGPQSFKPDFTPRADDGSRLSAPPPQLHLACPAPDEPDSQTTSPFTGGGEVPARTDSPADPTDSGALPDDLLSLLDG